MYLEGEKGLGVRGDAPLCLPHRALQFASEYSLLQGLQEEDADGSGSEQGSEQGWLGGGGSSAEPSMVLEEEQALGQGEGQGQLQQQPQLQQRRLVPGSSPQLAPADPELLEQQLLEQQQVHIKHRLGVAADGGTPQELMCANISSDDDEQR